ncbi:MAG TPA: 2-amino-4-hydroxy-6-hydroxymethyldihydropteridine diphosphokinase [Fimbriimonadaceae bacterium]|nr:2-amino-4-hydroxy-6-hydroxymethyldihydropteridine diphosphokinase [Fimbriimonadaceae bacterium]
MSPAPVVIALGSNVGDSLRYLQDAVAALRRAIRVERVSSVYRTVPMYVEDQPPFLNAALTGSTELGPRSLLRCLKEIESEIGRRDRARYGPREIDLDLIAYGSLSYAFTGGDKPLVVPHPKTGERRFVLAPLYEIDPGYKLVGLGAVNELLAQTNDQANDVERLDHAHL